MGILASNDAADPLFPTWLAKRTDGLQYSGNSPEVQGHGFRRKKSHIRDKRFPDNPRWDRRPDQPVGLELHRRVFVSEQLLNYDFSGN